MIVIDHQANRVNVSVFGEFTLADYKEFEEVVNFKVKFEGQVDLYFDLTQMAGLTLDVAWEEVKFSRHTPTISSVSPSLPTASGLPGAPGFRRPSSTPMSRYLPMPTRQRAGWRSKR